MWWMVMTAWAAPPNHCANAERVVLSCEIKDKPGKVLSLCATKDLTDDPKGGGALFYRFGKVGAVELQYPKEAVHPSKVFAYAFDETHPRASSASVTFVNEGHRFVITDSFHQGETSTELTIHLPSGKAVNLSCGETESDISSIRNAATAKLP